MIISVETHTCMPKQTIFNAMRLGQYPEKTMNRKNHAQVLQAVQGTPTASTALTGERVKPSWSLTIRIVTMKFIFPIQVQLHGGCFKQFNAATIRHTEYHINKNKKYRLHSSSPITEQGRCLNTIDTIFSYA